MVNRYQPVVLSGFLEERALDSNEFRRDEGGELRALLNFRGELLTPLQLK